MASRWSDIFEREPEHEPELGPSNEPGPQPDSWFADKVEDVPPMQATQAPQPEAEFQDGIEVEEEVILCAGLLPGAQIAERVGWALALLARTKVRSPARPRARHPARLPRSAFAVPARTALRACAPLAILTVPACSLGRRATAETASAADAGPGGRGCTRARESSRPVLLRRLGGVRGRRRSRVARRRRHFAAAVCVCVCACVCHLSEVFLMPNTHTGPGAGRWEGGGVQTSGRYNLY